MDNQIFRKNPLEKGWKFFKIMQKDRVVAKIYENGKARIYFKTFMPYNLYLEEGDDQDIRVNNLINFYYWCSSRVLTLDRKYEKEIFDFLSLTQAQTDKDRASIAISYHGLGLLDSFWIKNKNEKRKFKDINLFDNSLSNAFVDVALRGKNLTIDNHELYISLNKAADLNTPGVAPKAWIRNNNTFYLLKDGDLRDVDAEILASKIVKCFNVKSVDYDEYYYDGQKVSKCNIITSKELSIVPIEAIEIYCANKEINTLDFILKIDSYNYYMMNIIDYLIGNIDRHWGNWGFYVDNNKNKLLKLYPLMDFNKAFKSYDDINGTICQTTLGRRISQKEAAIEAVKKVGLNQIKPIEDNWFKDDDIKNVFFKRLEVLKNAI